MRTSTAAIPVAPRLRDFKYAIRNIVAEAKKVEASGRRVRYLNIGDPSDLRVQDAATHDRRCRARDARRPQRLRAVGGILPAREAVAGELTGRGMPMSPDRVVITSGTSEGIELVLTALAEAGDEVLIPSPTYPLYTAVLAKIGARAVFYRTNPDTGWLPEVDHVQSLMTPRTRALVVIDPNNPTGASYPADVRRTLIETADRHNVPILADEVYGDLAYSGPVPPMASLVSGRADHHVLVAVEGVSRSWLAGRLARRRPDRSPRRCARRGEEAGGRTALLAGTDAIRDRGRVDRRSLARAAPSRGAPRTRGDHHAASQRDRRHQRRRADGRLLRHAAGVAAAGRHRRRLRPRTPARRQACSASTDPGSVPTRTRASSASSFWRAPPSWRRSTGSSRISLETSCRAAI